MEINDPLHIDIIMMQLDLTSMITRNSVFKDCHWKSNTCISFTEIMGFEEEKNHTHNIKNKHAQNNNGNKSPQNPIPKKIKRNKKQTLKPSKPFIIPL